MKYKIEYTIFADSDTDEIIDFIAKDNPEKAIFFIDNLKTRINNTLGEFPKIGTDYKQFKHFSFDSYIVVYEIDESSKSVYINLITESHRHWKNILEGLIS